MNAVESGADPVERAKQRVVESLLLAVGCDDAIHELLGTGVDPARLVDRTVHEFRAVGIELAVTAHAIHFGCGRKNHTLAVLHCMADDWQIGFEVKFEYPQRFLDIGGRRRNGDQRHHGVAFADVIFDPLLVDGDVALEEMEAFMVHQRGDALALHVHAVHRPVGGVENTSGQMMADETVDAENQDFFHVRLNVLEGRDNGTAPSAEPISPGASRRPSSSTSTRSNTLPSAHCAMQAPPSTNSLGEAKLARRPGCTRVFRIRKFLPAMMVKAPG